VDGILGTRGWAIVSVNPAYLEISSFTIPLTVSGGAMPYAPINSFFPAFVE
jgi:hypothetical protein